MEPPERYCQEHKAWAEQRRAEAQRLYDQQERDQRIVEFYHSREWQALRLRALERDAYLCQPCLRERRITRADTVHHIVPVRVDWSRRLDLRNLEAICRSCHAKLHAAERNGQDADMVQSGHGDKTANMAQSASMGDRKNSAGLPKDRAPALVRAKLRERPASRSRKTSNPHNKGVQPWDAAQGRLNSSGSRATT